MLDKSETTKPSKLTGAQLRLLQRLAATSGSSVSIHETNEDSPDGLKFHGRFRFKCCQTCKHVPTEPTPWLPIFALAEAGLIKERMRGVSVYFAEDITPAGHAALASGGRL